ncbi:uncharacterized protein SPPG_04997 [Spizellomyces punctatus DAOM BR117]|uniref:Nascent polypeptide-associated complex subunit alpha-like UBA domain-containing protein n=1 Tax=Spizellomyces punctatus (strain DAOM BR117) TaxID=645134 RepID=A0A0L0HDU0_SPIPD|nr:uncharacterized protein SPPG_04997 [Spizellomyces punctatus DAOM BR117]KNC99610.1 hypothetical protein SPPG_04997 [Spizellomyces punctatus DAOM BR117]|eukprot:XP_016607650.1 hypothetical protein SPPG_04997 [Spizellomyces punctatus DAOM BR117]
MSAETLHTVRVKHGKDIQEFCHHSTALIHPVVSKTLQIPPTKLTLSKLFQAQISSTPAHMRKVHAGRKLSPTSTFADFPVCTTLLALGPRDENPDGCHPRDIEVLMAQLGVDRNTAIKALRNNGFDLVDAILHLG